MKKGTLIKVKGTAIRGYLLRGTNKRSRYALIYDIDKHCEYNVKAELIEEV